MGSARDVFTQFAAVRANYDAVSATTVLKSARLDTGLSIRGGLAWLIHALEFWFSDDSATASVVQTAALCTVDGLAAMPNIQDKGVIAKVNRQYMFASGVGFTEGLQQPMRVGFLPPVPIAAPSLTLYIATDVDNANLDGDEVACRIHFTTVPMSSAMYTEIAEVWGW